jgi:hypothetical protein
VEREGEVTSDDRSWNKRRLGIRIGTSIGTRIDVKYSRVMTAYLS